MASKGKAVALMYYGFPERREEMHDYLKSILHGREPPESLVRENLEKLDLVGGQTPSTAIVRSIKEKIERKLAGDGFEVYLLSKHYRPSIYEASELIDEEVVYEVPLFPVYSKYIFDGYFGPLESQLKGRKKIRVVDLGFQQVVINYYRTRIENDSTAILTFSAHSIPLEEDDPYSERILNLSRKIAGEKRFINIYHSQGTFHPNWLTPAPEYAIKYARENGFKGIKVVPIGFIYDHLEVLYDLDYRLKNQAAREGIGYERVPLPNDSDVVIDAISNLVKDTSLE